MAYAPYPNDRRNLDTDPRILGGFVEKDFENFFEFTDLNGHPSPFPGYEHRVFVGDQGQTRFARVLKTVAYIVTDEGDDGSPITEKWNIRNYREYAQ